MDIKLRNKILEILVNPTTVTTLKEKLPQVKSFGNLSYHLKILENEEIIAKDKDKKKPGQPTKYHIVSKIQLAQISKDNKEKMKVDIAYLEQIAKNPMQDHNILYLELKNKGIDLANVNSDITSDSINENLVTQHFKITPKGLKYLQELKSNLS